MCMFLSGLIVLCWFLLWLEGVAFEMIREVNVWPYGNLMRCYDGQYISLVGLGGDLRAL